MKVGFFQFAPKFGEIQRNLDQILNAIEAFTGDLLVLPELALSGYQFASKTEVEALAQDRQSPIFQTLQSALHDRGLHVALGFAECADGCLYNSAVLMGSEGIIGIYRKTHLFFEENLWFSPGNTGFQVWDIGGAKVGIMVCFDWFYPESARTLTVKGADILCHPSNLVLPFCPDAMVTRCLENRVFAVTANRIGQEERGGKPPLRFIGMSEVVAPNGSILHRAEASQSELYECEIDIAQARNKRINPYNDLLKDRQPQWYVGEGE